MTAADDRTWMLQALELAERGRGYVEPNPLVGAVVVKEGQLAGEGWHQRFGGAHAETHALEQAGAAARGATLYVTLEPCCHHGKTPPCTDGILKAGIARVVAAMADPFPQVSGKGVEQLRQAGVVVDLGAEETAARRLNAPYLTLLTQQRPYVHLKWAMTLDGKIATRTGDSKWISNEASRGHAHRLRGRMDGILVGSGTALADDPMLTARPAGPRLATRIVLDSKGRLPLSSQLVQTARQAPVLVVVHPSSETARHEALRARGCEVIAIDGAKGRIDLGAILSELGRRRMTNLLIEGGAEVIGEVIDRRVVEEIHVYVSPRLAGGRRAYSASKGQGIDRIAESLKISELTAEPLSGDVYLHGRSIS